MSVDEPTECRICHNQRASDACGPRCGAQACSCWGSSWSSLGTREGPSWPCRWERLTRRSLGMKLPWLRPIVNKVRAKQNEKKEKHGKSPWASREMVRAPGSGSVAALQHQARGSENRAERSHRNLEVAPRAVRAYLLLQQEVKSRLTRSAVPNGRASQT